MPFIQHKLHVLMEDETEYEVVADQRDVAAWERQPFGTSYAEAESRSMLFIRFLSWNALKRTKRFRGDWEAFDNAAVECRALPMEPEEEAVNPGHAAPSEDI